jgi:hypothetical protein
MNHPPRASPDSRRSARYRVSDKDRLVNDKDIAPHIPVIDKSKREDGTFSREDFTFDKERNVYICPAGKVLTTTGKLVNDGETLLYLSRTRDCRSCLLKARCCPKTPFRRIQRSGEAASPARRAATASIAKLNFSDQHHITSGGFQKWSKVAAEVNFESALTPASKARKHIGSIGPEAVDTQPPSGPRSVSADACRVQHNTLLLARGKDCRHTDFNCLVTRTKEIDHTRSSRTDIPNTRYPPAVAEAWAAAPWPPKPVRDWTLSERRRFPPPWSVEELKESYVVKDATEQALDYFYFEDEPGRRSAG